MHHRGWSRGASTLHASTFILLLPPLLIAFPLSLAVLILHEISINILRAHTLNDTLVLPAGSVRSSFRITINKLPSDLIVGTSIGTMIFSTMAALGIWELRKKDLSSTRHQRLWGWINIFAVLANLGLVTACTVLVFLAQRDDDRRHIDLSYVEGKDPRQYLTKETLLCKVKKLDGVGSWADLGCGFAIASRWMLVPLGACSLLMGILCLWQIFRKDGKKVMFGMQTQSKGTGVDLQNF